MHALHWTMIAEKMGVTLKQLEGLFCKKSNFLSLEGTILP